MLIFSIFGQNEKIYFNYYKNIKKEYSFLNDIIYKKYRLKFLKFILNKDNIYIYYIIF